MPPIPWHARAAPRPFSVISRAATVLIRVLIRFYQRILNPMLKFAAGPGVGCRFTPTCSNYFLQAVETHGPLKGSWLGIRRIFRCHPWGGWGYDPVPTRRGTDESATTPPPDDDPPRP